jgi:hypothetical protein
MIQSTARRRPPMGWNSWDCYGTTVTEAEVLANADFMARHLLPYGWNTVVVDIQWYDPDARAGGYNDDPRVCLDDWGRQLPAPNRFPSAADGAGFAPLATRVQELGLQFGVHIMRGIPRAAVERRLPVLGGGGATAADIADADSVCAWNGDNFGLDHAHPVAQAYYDAQVAQFAAWGVDFIKADDMLAPYHGDEIEAYARAIERSGRDIRLSLSPGTALSLARLDHLRRHATMWRVSDDLWDRWSDVEAQFARLARWAPHQDGIGPDADGWADADMLPLGRIGIRAERGDDRLSRLTPDEQRTLMTLWCIARSPLMFGGDLPSTPPETIALLTNGAVLEMFEASTDPRELWREGDTVAWGSHASDGPARFAALFNTADDERVLHVEAGALGLDDAPATELWSGSVVAPVDGAFALRVPAHGVALLRN